LRIPWVQQEFRGFASVYTSSAAGDLTVEDYYSTEGQQTPQNDPANYNSGQRFEADVYQGNSTSGPLLHKQTMQYSGSNGVSASCQPAPFIAVPGSDTSGTPAMPPAK